MPDYPAADRLELVDDLHGRAVPDPYRWLEDPTDPRTVSWRAAQDELMAAERAEWTMRDRFAERIEALMGAGSISPPYIRGNWTFTTKREPGQQFPVLYVRGTDEPVTGGL
ncbi:MAG: S9 family peptidase, partial [Candidatus Nanopelagicales bacterium]